MSAPPHATTVVDQIQGFMVPMAKAVSVLYQNRFFGQALIVVYSTIDTMGLLDAPPEQVEASGESFRGWVRKYMLTDPRANFNEMDLWSARCAVLHTLTTESKLSKQGKARELQYYSGDKESEFAKLFVKVTPTLHQGQHLPVHLEDLCAVFYEGIKKFTFVLHENCVRDLACHARLRKVMKMHPIPAGQTISLAN